MTNHKSFAARLLIPLRPLITSQSKAPFVRRKSVKTWIPNRKAHFQSTKMNRLTVNRNQKKSLARRVNTSHMTQSKSVSIIIPACNEARTLNDNLKRLKQWHAVREIIVVANGCEDNTVVIAEKAGAKVVVYAERLGHDTGRAIGAKLAKGKYLLFLDGDIVWNLEDLRPFVYALQRGADVALNEYPRKESKFYHHPTAIGKRALNIALGRPDLAASSLTSVPHAIRRSVLPVIGYETLAVPPLAYTKASLLGFTIVTAHHVNVRLRNTWKPRYQKSYSTTELIIGDHIQALSYLIQQRGVRGGFIDNGRNREIIEQRPHELLFPNDIQVAAVIPARNEARTIPSVIRELRHAKIEKICVVENGSYDGTHRVAAKLGADVYHFDRSLGHDVGRVLGIANVLHAECALVLDSDFSIHSYDLAKYVTCVLDFKVDVALNNLSQGLPASQKKDRVSTMKAFLNIALQRPDLGICSLTAVPHALSRRAQQTIPLQDFAVPPKAQVRAVLAGLNVQPVHYVNVIRSNRYRPWSHSRRHGSPVAKMIIGDHIEAIALLIQERGERGGFVQPRRLDLIEVEGPPVRA